MVYRCRMAMGSSLGLEMDIDVELNELLHFLLGVLVQRLGYRNISGKRKFVL